MTTEEVALGIAAASVTGVIAMVTEAFLIDPVVDSVTEVVDAMATAIATVGSVTVGATETALETAGGLVTETEDSQIVQEDSVTGVVVVTVTAIATTATEVDSVGGMVIAMAVTGETDMVDLMIAAEVASMIRAVDLTTATVVALDMMTRVSCVQHSTVTWIGTAVDASLMAKCSSFQPVTKLHKID